MQPTPQPGITPYCSFCRKQHPQIARLVEGPGVHICDGCVALCSRILTGKPTAPFTAWETLTDDELLATLPAAVDAVDATEATLRDHVAALRGRAISWERIAATLGVSRQAAWERFSREV